MAKRPHRPSAGAAPEPSEADTALVIASHGRHCTIELASGLSMRALTKGKRSDVVVGDQVHWRATGDEAVVDHIQARRSLLYRQDEARTKSFAANVDQAVLVLAAAPVYPQALLDRTLLACEASDVRVLIVLNKSDLAEPFAAAWARLAPYRAMGYAVLPLSLRTLAPGAADEPAQPMGLAALRERLRGQTSLIFGPSGAGKSTLVNHLVPEALATTGEISLALGTGRHTTTATRWYWLDRTDGSALIDSPGFQEFGLHHLQGQDIAALMPDLRAHLGHCRFANCSHLHEPDCGVRAHVASADDAVAGATAARQTQAEIDPAGLFISPSRYIFYSSLMAELAQARPH